MKTAKFVRRAEGNWIGDARLYRLSEPVKFQNWRTGMEGSTSYVVVSAVDVPRFGPETYIFAAGADGASLESVHELDGSFQGALDHRKALRDGGWEVKG